MCEQSSNIVVNKRTRIFQFEALLYIYYIHLEPKIENCRFQLKKEGARPISREHRGSKRAQQESTGGAQREHKGAPSEQREAKGDHYDYSTRSEPDCLSIFSSFNLDLSMA